MLDAVIVMVVATIVCVETLLRQLTETAGESRAAAAVAMSYPLLDLGLVAALVFGMYAGGQAPKRAIALTLAVGARMFSDFAHTYAAAYYGYDGNPGGLDLGFMASYLLIGVAAWLPPAEATLDAAEREPARWGFVMPYCAVLLLTSITIGASLWGAPPPTLVIGAGVAIALAAVRQTATTFDHLRIYRELQRSLSVEREAARKDALTGALNHGAISSELAAAIAAQTPGDTHALVMVDIDGLKATNDTFGHQAGDRLLKRATEVLRRDGAVVGRYAGDEFAVLLPSADRANAERYVADVTTSLAASDLRDEATGSHIPVQASMGIAVFPDEAETVPDLIKLADSAMYVSKRSHPDEEPREVSLRSRRDDAAAPLVAELIPLLASPGDLQMKLTLIGHRLAAACRYEGVRIAIFGPAASPPVISTIVGRGHALSRSGSIGAPILHDEQPLRAILEETKRPLIIDDMTEDDRFSSDFREVLRALEVHAALVAPILWHDEVIGSIGAGRREKGSFSPRDAQLLATIAGQIAAIVRMANMVESLEETSERIHEEQAETVMMLAAVAEAHDRTTGLHLVSIRKLAEALATELGYSDERAYDLGLAAVLHDIGKVNIPKEMLSSAGRLGGDQWEVMKQHTIWGHDFLASRPGFELAASVARSHHERWDGAGYPDGLAGEDILEEAAIVTVADSFDAMTDDRPYRAGLAVHQALAEIVLNRGSQFSPRVVDALLRLHERGWLDGTAHTHDSREAA